MPKNHELEQVLRQYISKVEMNEITTTKSFVDMLIVEFTEFRSQKTNLATDSE